MKKILCIAISVLLIASLLSGCFAQTKEYTCDGLTMTVPSSMRDVSSKSDFQSYTFTLDSSKIAIFGLKEPFSDFEDGENLTLEDYANAVIDGNELDCLAITRAGKGYMYFRYEADSADGTYKYLTGVYRANDCFWLVQIAALTKDYAEEDFFTYLDSVKFA